MTTDMSKQGMFIGAIAGLVLVLVGFISVQERVVQQGTEVILATRPVDPRDLFRGEYVILRYTIERDEQVRAALSADTDATRVYVRLVDDEQGIARVGAAQTTRPDVSDGVWLEGAVVNGQARFPDLEQYFVPEGAGRPIERMRSGLHVRVRVLDGEGRVVGLLDEDLTAIDAAEYVE